MDLRGPRLGRPRQGSASRENPHGRGPFNARNRMRRAGPRLGGSARPARDRAQRARKARFAASFRHRRQRRARRQRARHPARPTAREQSGMSSLEKLVVDTGDILAVAEMRYAHLSARLYNTPLLILPDKAAVIESVLARYINGETPVVVDAAQYQSDSAARKPYRVTSGGVAVIPVMGTLVSRGGDANGVFDLGNKIMPARSQMAIWAMADGDAFSAAYAIASAAEKVYTTRAGMAGSIGVIAMHMDQCARLEMAGVKYTAIIAGDKKADFGCHLPLSDRAR